MLPKTMVIDGVVLRRYYKSNFYYRKCKDHDGEKYFNYYELYDKDGNYLTEMISFSSIGYYVKFGKNPE